MSHSGRTGDQYWADNRLTDSDVQYLPHRCAVLATQVCGTLQTADDAQDILLSKVENNDEAVLNRRQRRMTHEKDICSDVCYPIPAAVRCDELRAGADIDATGRLCH
jgi:hypothetical protein